MKHIAVFVSLCLFFLSAGQTLAASQEQVGIVRSVRGTAFLQQAESSREAALGQAVHLNDTLKTGADGAIGIILKDNTMITIGPDSELAVSSFTFAPREKQFSLITRLLKGTAAYLSGTIGKLAPDSVKFETPSATLGIRGTKFLVKVP